MTSGLVSLAYSPLYFLGRKNYAEVGTGDKSSILQIINSHYYPYFLIVLDQRQDLFIFLLYLPLFFKTDI